MRRRDFIALSGAAVVWPLTVHAQQAGKVPIIGFLGTNASAWRPWTDTLVGRLRELGWIEGRTITLEYRWSEGRPELYAEIAAEFVRLHADVIVANGTAVPTVKQATSAIPIVFPITVDPVGGGLVASLRDQAATSLDCRSNSPMRLASDSNSCARLFPVSADWQS